MGELQNPENPYDEASNPYVNNNGDTDLVGKDFYRLYLDMSARPVQGAYLMILVDRSTSMQDVDVVTADGIISRIAAVNQVLGTTGKNYGNGLIKDFLQAHSGNRVSIISFGGVDDYHSFTDDAETVVGWSDATNFGGNLSASAHGVWAAPKQPAAQTQGTNYCAGLKMAAELWGENVPASAPKVMVIISDGEPTFYLNYDAESTRYGNGQTPCHAQSKLYFANFHAANPGVHVEAVGFGQNFATETLDYMAQNADSSSSARALTADNTAELTAALRSQIFPSHVEIKDVLSRYVRCYTENADFKVTRTDTTVTNPTPAQPATVTIYENGAPVGDPENGGDGYMTSVDGALRPIVMSFEYIIDNDYAAAPDTALSTGVVTVKFDPEFVVEPQYVYTISFNVALTQKAYDTYDNNNINYLHKGDADTDYPGTTTTPRNDTSSDKWGFRSNNEATHIIYGVGNDVNLIESYNHPVVQVQGAEPLPPEQQTGKLPVRKVWDDDGHTDLRTPVTLRLYAYGTINGVEYSHSAEADNRFFTGRQVVLDGTEPTPWTYTFEGIPLYQTNEHGDPITDPTTNALKPLDYFIVEDPVPDNYTASYGEHPRFSVAFLPGDSPADANALNPNALGGNVSAAAAGDYYIKLTGGGSSSVTYYKEATSLTAGKKYLLGIVIDGNTYIVSNVHDSTSPYNDYPYLYKANVAAHGSGYDISITGKNVADYIVTLGGNNTAGYTFTNAAAGSLGIVIASGAGYLGFSNESGNNNKWLLVNDTTGGNNLKSKNVTMGSAENPVYISCETTTGGAYYLNFSDSDAETFTFYEQVTETTGSTPQLEVGAEYLITYETGGNTYAIQTTYYSSSNYQPNLAKITPVDASAAHGANAYTIDDLGANTALFTVGGDASGGWTFNCSAGYLAIDTYPEYSSTVGTAGNEQWEYDTITKFLKKKGSGSWPYLSVKLDVGSEHIDSAKNEGTDPAFPFTFYKKVTAPAPETGALTIELTSTDNTEISNREFTISNGSGYSRTVTTVADGTVTVSGLEEGSYMITPTPVTGCTYNPINRAANVMAGQTTPVRFTITTPSAAPSGNFSEAVVTNTLNLQTLKFVKRARPTDTNAPLNSGVLLGGAVFELYRTDAAFSQPELGSDGLPVITDPRPETFVGSYTSTATGIVEIRDLPCGNYLLYERTAPEGYDTDAGVLWHVVVTNSGVTLTDAAENPVPTDNIDGKDLPLILNRSSLGFELPSVGGSGVLPYTLCGVMLMLLPLMYLAYDRGRKRKGGIKKGASSR